MPSIFIPPRFRLRRRRFPFSSIFKNYVHVPSGGITFGGSAASSRTFTHTPTGGITFGGSSPVTLILATPTLPQVEGATRNEIFKRFLRETGLGTYGVVTGISGDDDFSFDDASRLKSTQFNAADWRGAWVRIVKNDSSVGTVPEGDVRPVTDYDPTNGRITVSPNFTSNMEIGDEYELWRFPNPLSVIDDLDVCLREDIFLPCWTILSEAPDYDMEQNNISDWIALSGTVSKIGGQPSMDGARWLALATNNMDGEAKTNNFKVEPSKKYFASVVGMALQGSNTLSFAAYDETNGATLGTTTWDRQYPGRMHFEFTTPANCYEISLFFNHSDVTGVAVSLWDELSIYPSDAYDIALPWWVKNKNQVKAVFQLHPVDVISPYSWDAELRGKFVDYYEIHDTAFGSKPLRLVLRHNNLGTAPLFIFGVRNETAYEDDNDDVKRVDENLIIACLAVKVFKRLKTFPNSNAMQTTWIERQYDEWYEIYRKLTRSQGERIEEIIHGYQESGHFIDSRFALNR